MPYIVDNLIQLVAESDATFTLRVQTYINDQHFYWNTVGGSFTATVGTPAFIGYPPISPTSDTFEWDSVNLQFIRNVTFSYENTYYYKYLGISPAPPSPPPFPIVGDMVIFGSGGTLVDSGLAFDMTAMNWTNLAPATVAGQAVEFSQLSGVGTVTNVATAGLISGGPITNTGTITTSMTTNRLVGRGTAGTGIMEEIILGTNLSLTGTTLNATGGGVTSVTGTSPIISSGGTTPAISMTAAAAGTNGYLSGTDWIIFNSKQGAITLTTVGTTGASTFIANTLNIPSYVDQFVGTVTSVGLTVPTAFSVTGSPITTSGTLAITGAGLVSQYIDGTGSLQAFPPVGTGTVTSVAASVPTFLSVSGSPITTSGTLAVTLSGTALPVLNGGTGVTTSTGSGNTVLSTSPTLVTPILGSASATALTFTSTAVSGLTINRLTTAQRQALTPVIGDVVYDTTIGTTCTYTGTFWQYSKEYYVTAFATTITTLASAITGLTTFTLEANSTYAISGAFLIGCSNTGGIKFGNTLPAGGASFINYVGTSTAATGLQQVSSLNGTLTATAVNRFATSSYLTFGGSITTVATAGSVDINFASGIGGQTSTVYGQFSIGYQSKITLTKIA
jgi:hypothetical protein